MGEIIGLGCTHYPGLTVPDERLPETLGRHPVVRDYAETHIFMSDKFRVLSGITRQHSA